MMIKRLFVENFRNIKCQEFAFHKGVNILFGANAQGKTNLIEAISVCIGTGFRGAKIQKFMPFELEKNKAVKLRLIFIDEQFPNKENTIDYTIVNHKAVIKYNGIALKDAMQLYGMLKYVVFIPQHLDIIKGSPELRRDYFDNVASMQSAVHLKKLARYNKALRNKNNLLAALPPNADMEVVKIQLEAWNEILAIEGINVTYGRLKYFSLLEKIAAEIYANLTNGKEQLTMAYHSTIFGEKPPDFTEKDSLFRQYIAQLEADFSKEIKFRHTQSGVHRDDIAFFINGRGARDFASQGQLRSIALTLKLAEAEIIRIKQSRPIMMLDDVLSELDSTRRDFVLNNIENSQVFITACNREDLKGLACGKVWQVENGEFSELGCLL